MDFSRRLRRPPALLALAACLPAAGAVAHHAVRAALARTAERMSAKYNMSISLAYHSPELSLAVAAGQTDAGLDMGVPSRTAKPDDLYVWGSTTKMFTAPAVLQLVERGVVSLTDPIAKHIDPILLKLNGTRLEDHFGASIASVHVEHLLHMTSGLADYDGEAFARDQFAHRSKAFGPVEIIGKYVDPTLTFPPGTKQEYCSTNYILLGLLLAHHGRAAGQPWSWQGFDQLSVVPKDLRGAFSHSKFANNGPCKDFTPVHGFMDSYSTASLPSQDVWNVSCAGGWTAGNYIGPTADVARFTYELYNVRNPLIVSKSSQAKLINFAAPSSVEASGSGFKFYGMGTFSLDWSVGDAEAYGHVGDTYGYQSQTTYFPGLDFVLSVATNVETASQAQPADTTCIAYHEVVAALQGTTPPSCTFTVPYRFVGKCTCTQTVVV
mmetsp:Transcript_117297/g.373673  ORF Transcript_117297/g.373673 Transcript_117297/m.373673 type:complete len:437 (+) Transcript_117297:65-1375(+)